VTIIRQLTQLGASPEFGPVKNGVPRTIDLAHPLVNITVIAQVKWSIDRKLLVKRKLVQSKMKCLVV
jgi:hypothetical protein